MLALQKVFKNTFTIDSAKECFKLGEESRFEMFGKNYSQEKITRKVNLIP